MIYNQGLVIAEVSVHQTIHKMIALALQLLGRAELRYANAERGRGEMVKRERLSIRSRRDRTRQGRIARRVPVHMKLPKCKGPVGGPQPQNIVRRSRRRR